MPNCSAAFIMAAASSTSGNCTPLSNKCLSTFTSFVQQKFTRIPFSIARFTFDGSTDAPPNNCKNSAPNSIDSFTYVSEFPWRSILQIWIPALSFLAAAAALAPQARKHWCNRSLFAMTFADSIASSSPPFKCTLSQIFSGIKSSASCKVGIRISLNCSPLKLPASSSFNWASVKSLTAPDPFVVRSRVESCIRTSFLSFVSATSNSIMCTPRRIASFSAATVFSGCVVLAPRCAQIPRPGISNPRSLWPITADENMLRALTTKTSRINTRPIIDSFLCVASTFSIQQPHATLQLTDFVPQKKSCV